MSLPDTPYLGRHACPTCEPDADPSREIVEIRYCPAHELRTEGAEDQRVQALSYLSGSGEAGGDDNRAWCELVHRKTRLLTGGAPC